MKDNLVLVALFFVLAQFVSTDALGRCRQDQDFTLNPQYRYATKTEEAKAVEEKRLNQNEIVALRSFRSAYDSVVLNQTNSDELFNKFKDLKEAGQSVGLRLSTKQQYIAAREYIFDYYFKSGNDSYYFHFTFEIDEETKKVIKVAKEVLKKKNFWEKYFFFKKIEACI